MTDYTAMDFTAGATIPPPATAQAFAGSLVEETCFYVTASGLYLKGFQWWVAPAGGQSVAAQPFALRQATGSGASTYVPGSVVTSGPLTAGQVNTVLYDVPVALTQNIPYTVATGLPGAFPFTTDYWTTSPYSGGLTSGPLVIPSGFDGNEPPGLSILQSEFVTGAADPTGAYTFGGNNNYNAWIAPIITTDDTGVTSWQVFPSVPAPPADLAGTDAATIAVEFSVSEAVTLMIGHYSPPSATVLPESAGLWDVATQAILVQALAASWSGAAGSGWVYCTNLPAVTLQPGVSYKASTFLSTSGSEWFLATTNYWGTGPGQGGFTNGILTVPDNAHADPGQCSFTAGAFTYPGTIDNENYWINAIVTPASAPPSSVNIAQGRKHIRGLAEPAASGPAGGTIQKPFR